MVMTVMKRADRIEQLFCSAENAVQARERGDINFPHETNKTKWDIRET